MDLTYMVEVDNRGSMQAHKFIGIQLGFLSLDSFAQQMSFAPHMQADVIVCSLDPLYITHPNDRVCISVFYQKALRIWARSRGGLQDC